MTIAEQSPAVVVAGETVAYRYLGQLTEGRRLRLGSRSSPMAMAQVRHVSELLRVLVPKLAVDVEPFNTSADLWSGDLAQLGGKGAFTREIDRALLMGRIDAAVHCMKDVPGDVPLAEGTEFGAYLRRGDVRDCVVFPASSQREKLADLPAGARVGTSAIRRKAQLAVIRPDLSVHRLRGNVNTRLAKLDNGEFDALVLAREGLSRIGMDDRAGELLDMPPAVGAGVVGIQHRSDDHPIRDLIGLLDHSPTRQHVTAERMMLHCLQGHCNSPIAGHCNTEPDGQLHLRGMVFTRDGGEFLSAAEWGGPGTGAELGAFVGGKLLRQGARDLIAGIPH